ncbi:hypothetical protein [Guggenheimella bovis]
MNQNKGTVTLVAGLGVILLSVILFFVVFKEKSVIDWVAFLFLILSECVSLLGLLALESIYYKPSQTRIKKQLSVVLLGYVLIAIIISVVFMGKRQDQLWTMVIIQFLLLVSLVIFSMLTLKNTSETKEEAVSKPVSPLEDARTQFGAIVERYEDRLFQFDLRELLAKLSFQDMSKVTEYDDEILTLVKELQNPLEDERITECIEELKTLVKSRERAIQPSFEDIELE